MSLRSATTLAAQALNTRVKPPPRRTCAMPSGSCSSPVVSQASTRALGSPVGAPIATRRSGNQLCPWQLHVCEEAGRARQAPLKAAGKRRSVGVTDLFFGIVVAVLGTQTPCPDPPWNRLLGRLRYGRRVDSAPATGASLIGGSMLIEACGSLAAESRPPRTPPCRRSPVRSRHHLRRLQRRGHEGRGRRAVTTARPRPPRAGPRSRRSCSCCRDSCSARRCRRPSAP